MTGAEADEAIATILRASISRPSRNVGINGSSASRTLETFRADRRCLIAIYGWVMLALARALIDHPERTLNAAEIDAVIAQTLTRQALAAEQGRRAAWRRVTERVAEITS
jgi:hypothetical protein